jgi:phage terminase large subunit-like protein
MRLLNLLREKAQTQRQTQIVTWFQDPSDHPSLKNTPLGRKHYPKQMKFFSLEKTDDEIALFGGNRTGKTHCGCFADVLHLTGLYPDWWPGRRFTHPIDMWVATDTAKNTRDILQEKFCGKPGQEQALGTGMIPGDLIVRRTVKHGLADAFESVFVRHVSGGVSTLQFKSYDQGRESFQGTRQHRIHLDEEPKLEIYTECLLRLMSTVPGEQNGTLVLTETPMLGVSDLMITFMPDLSPEPDAVAAGGWDMGRDEEEGLAIDEEPA